MPQRIWMVQCPRSNGCGRYQGRPNIPQQPYEQIGQRATHSTSGGVPRYIITRQQIWGLEQLPRAVIKRVTKPIRPYRVQSPSGRTKLDWHLDNASPVSWGPLSGGVFGVVHTWQQASCGLWRAHWVQAWGMHGVECSGPGEAVIWGSRISRPAG